MNESTKRNLIRFLAEEAEKAKRAEQVRYKDNIQVITKAMEKAEKEINSLAPKILKKHGLTLKTNGDCRIRLYESSFKEYETYANKMILSDKYKKVDEAFSRIERKVLLGVDEEASAVLAAFAQELKAI